MRATDAAKTGLGRLSAVARCATDYRRTWRALTGQMEMSFSEQDIQAMLVNLSRERRHLFKALDNLELNWVELTDD